MSIETVHTITGTSPTSATTAAVGSAVEGLRKYDRVLVDAKLIGSTNGTVDLTLQRKVKGLDVWVDWLHFPQVAAGATKYYCLNEPVGVGIKEVDWDTEASPAAAVLAANEYVGGHPGDTVRAVVTAGAGTTDGATQLVYITGYIDRDS